MPVNELIYIGKIIAYSLLTIAYSVGRNGGRVISLRREDSQQRNLFLKLSLQGLDISLEDLFGCRSTSPLCDLFIDLEIN